MGALYTRSRIGCPRCHIRCGSTLEAEQIGVDTRPGGFLAMECRPSSIPAPLTYISLRAGLQLRLRYRWQGPGALLLERISCFHAGRSWCLRCGERHIPLHLVKPCPPPPSENVDCGRSRISLASDIAPCLWRSYTGPCVLRLRHELRLIYISNFAYNNSDIISVAADETSLALPRRHVEATDAWSQPYG